MKKQWKKPVMTIISKSTAEENVLDSCKGFSGGGLWSGGPGNSVCTAQIIDGSLQVCYTAASS
jgi:hypothetical protein